MTTLDQIRKQVDALAATIDAPPAYLPTYGGSEHTGRPHIEIGLEGTLHWVVCERGSELTRRTTRSLDELLYWIFESVTAEMASHWEARHRKADEDFRKQMFAKHLELLDRLNSSWTARQRMELGPLLQEVGL